MFETHVMRTVLPAAVISFITSIFTIGFLLETTDLKTSSREQESYKASRFIIVDSEGRTRAALGLNGDQPGLKLYGVNGETRAMVEILDNGEPRIGIAKDGVVRAEMSFENFYDGPMFELTDSKGIDVVRLRLDAYDDPRLHLQSTSNGKILNIEPSPMR
jgi:hypothetical protein